MIQKNEAANLPRCIASVRDLVSEIIIADTGSTDCSISLARSLGAHVFSVPWADDFSGPRNATLARASCEWILILDPDETISPLDLERFRSALRSAPVSAFRLHTRNYTGNPTQQGAVPCDSRYAEARGFPSFVQSTKTRLFRRALGLKFRGAWHELLDWDIQERQIPVGYLDVPVHHFPLKAHSAGGKKKSLFYLQLGLKKVKEWPLNGHAWHELFVAYMVLKDWRAAAFCAGRCSHLGVISPDRFFGMARALNELNMPDLGRLAFEKGICLLYPHLTHIEPDKRSLSDLSC